MNYSGIIQATVIGELAYKLIKSNEKMTAERLLKEVKVAEIDWCYDEESTVNIANRINELGWQEDENPEQYNERLNNDFHLTALLELASPVEAKDVGQVRKLPEKPPKLLGREQDLSKLMAIIECNNPYSDILVRGMGGVGKTVICRSLAYRCNESQHINDILWVNSHNGLAAYLRAVVAPAYEIDVQHPDWLKHLIAQLGRAASPSVMFLDNFEGSEQDSEIFNQLKQLNWHIIATSRHVLNQFSKTYTIEAMTAKFRWIFITP